MNKYENHEDEWREEANRERWEREQARRNRWIDPRDPDYIAPEAEDMTDSTSICGRCEKETDQEICEKCMEIMLLGAQEHRFEPDENFFKEIGVKRYA